MTALQTTKRCCHLFATNGKVHLTRPLVRTGRVFTTGRRGTLNLNLVLTCATSFSLSLGHSYSHAHPLTVRTWTTMANWSPTNSGIHTHPLLLPLPHAYTIESLSHLHSNVHTHRSMVRRVLKIGKDVLTDSDILRLFGYWDTDGSGTLTTTELFAALQKDPSGQNGDQDYDTSTAETPRCSFPHPNDQNPHGSNSHGRSEFPNKSRAGGRSGHEYRYSQLERRPHERCQHAAVHLWTIGSASNVL